MFTGIIDSPGWVLTLDEDGDGLTFSVRCPELQQVVEEGESVAVNGVCLTATEVEPAEPILHFHIVRETLDRTNLSSLDIGDRVNIEPSLQVGDDLSGHFIMGHVDATGRVERVEERDRERTMWISVPQFLRRFVFSKGCVALDGVSLTPVEIKEDRFSVELIPETLERTTLGERTKGERVNIEVDLIARYVGEGLERMGTNVPGPETSQ